MIIISSHVLRWDREVAAIRLRTRTPKHGPCVVCGAAGIRHHPHYMRPQETFPLCASHHRKLHVRLTKRGRDPRMAYFKERAAGVDAPREAAL